MVKKTNSGEKGKKSSKVKEEQEVCIALISLDWSRLSAYMVRFYIE